MTDSTYALNSDDLARSNQPPHIPASIEISPKQAVESADLPGLFPLGVRVYLTDVGGDDAAAQVRAAKRVIELGYQAVPHIAARRLPGRKALEDRLAAMTQEAGVRDVLVIGGGLASPAGVFSSSMQLIETGLLDRFGITHIGVAGHPEGNPDFPQQVALETLRLKQRFAERTDARMRIVTQFGFDAQKFVAWTEAIHSNGIDMPVHLGVAGPAKLTTLIKYATTCGVGNSLNFLMKQTRSLTKLVTTHSPEDVVAPIERHWRNNSQTAVRQIHVFPFGGVTKATEWLSSRGSWCPSRSDRQSA